MTRPDVRALMAITALGAVMIFPFMVVLGAGFAKQFYGGRGDALGIMMAGSGAGALTGALVLLTVSDAERMRRIGICTVGMGVALGAYALSRSLPLTVMAIFALTFCVSSAMGLASTILQQSVPDHLRGRVMSINTLLFIGLMPFAALGLGGLSDRVGLPRVMGGAAIAHVIGSVLLLRRAVVAHRVVSSDG
jgi:MFS family permease